MSVKRGLLSERRLFQDKDKRELTRVALCFALAFLFCGFSAGGELSPFGSTFALCLPYGCVFAGIPGSALGYAASLGRADMLRYWLALLIGGTLRVLLHTRSGEKRSEALSPALSAVGILLSGAVALVLKGFSAEEVLLLVSEAAVSFCMGIFFRRASALLGVKRGSGRMNAADKSVLICCTGVFLLCASGYTVTEISPVRILSFLAVMLACFYKGAPFGCAAGACMGTFLSVRPGFGCLLAAMTVGGFASGIASSCGQLMTAAVFSLTAVITAIFQGKGEEAFPVIAECIISSAMFSLIPSGLLMRLRDYIREKTAFRDDKAEKQVAYDLSRASRNVHRICDIINVISDSIQRKDSETDGAETSGADELQRLLTDQFRGIGDYLGELSLRADESRIPDPSYSAAIKKALREEGIEADTVNFFYSSIGSVTVEATVEGRPSDIDQRKIKSVIEAVTERSFDRAVIEEAGFGMSLSFSQSVPFRLQIGISSKAAREKEPCGDSVSAASAVDGRGFVLISDGMGTGYYACADSTLTAKVMKKLVCSGFSFDSAMKIVNSALIARSGQESVASIDALEVNLFTGEATFYKAGAALSVIRKRERTVVLERSSMPLGILRNIRFSKARFTGEAGDIVLLLSDGVTQNDCGWINDELLSWSTDDMKQLSTHILKLATLRAEKETADDMTVVAVKIEENRKRSI